MRTVRTKVYKFEELNETAKNVAIKIEREKYYSYGEPLAFFNDHCKEVLKEAGYGDCEVQYRLSCSQGDGLSFKTSRIDIERLINECIPNIKKTVLDALLEVYEWKITGNTGRYCYASKNDVDFDQYDYNKEYPNLFSLAQQIKGDIQSKYMDICKELENEGYEWIEYEDKDETITERIIDNDNEFTAEGEIFNN